MACMQNHRWPEAFGFKDEVGINNALRGNSGCEQKHLQYQVAFASITKGAGTALVPISLVSSLQSTHEKLSDL